MEPFHAILVKGERRRRHPAVPILGKCSSVPFSAVQGRDLAGFGKNHPRRSGSGIFPENLARGGTPQSCPRIGNDKMFHINKEYNEDNDRIKKEKTDMENHPHTAHGTWFQLSLHAGSISRMGGCRHRFLQGILPVPLRDSLPSGNAGHHRRHTEFSNLLNI